MTQGLGARPASTARLAARPAATTIAASVAVVQLVMAAMAIAPWPSSKVPSPVSTVNRSAMSPWPFRAAAPSKRPLSPAGVVRLWGREGPASEVPTDARSSSSVLP